MKKHIIIAGALLLAFTAAAVASPAGTETGEKKMSKKAAKLMAKAETAIREKQPDQAMDLLRQIVPLEPENAKVRHYLGMLLDQKGLPDEAIASFEEALRLRLDYLNAQLALRQTLFEAGKAANGKQEYEKSNEYLLKLIGLPYNYTGKENDVMLTMTRFFLGFNFFNLKQYPQAQENFKLCQAMEGLETDNLDLYANATYFLGMIDFIEKRNMDSADNFKKFLKLYATEEKKPQFFAYANFFVGNNLFLILEKKMAKGEVAGMETAVEEIIPYFEQAIADKFPNEDAHVMLGNCHVYRKDYAAAIKTYQQLIEAFPQSAQLENYKSFLAKLQEMQQQEQKEQKAKKKR